MWPVTLEVVDQPYSIFHWRLTLSIVRWTVSGVKRPVDNAASMELHVSEALCSAVFHGCPGSPLHVHRERGTASRTCCVQHRL